MTVLASDGATGAVLAPAAPGAVARLVRREARREWRLVAVVVAVTLAGSACVALGPTLVQRAIDEGLVGGDTEVLSRSVLAYLAVLVVGGLAAGVRAVAATTAVERSMDRLRVDALAGILGLDLGTYERTRRGDLLSRVTADTEDLSGAARWFLPDALRYVVELLTALVAVALLDPVLALVAMVAVPPWPWRAGSCAGGARSCTPATGPRSAT